MNDVLLLCLSLFGGTDFLPPPSPEINALVNQLGTSEYAVRAKAYHELQRRGGSAITALKMAQSNPDLEVSRRATKLVSEFYDIGTTPSIYQLLPQDQALEHYQRIWGQSVAWEEPWYHEFCYDDGSPSERRGNTSMNCCGCFIRRW